MGLKRVISRTQVRLRRAQIEREQKQIRRANQAMVALHAVLKPR